MPLASESLEMKQGASGMRKRILAASGLLGLFLVGFAGLYRDLAAQIQPDPQLAFTATLDKEIRDFLKHEVTAHVADITSLDPPPDRVVGALTTGEFSWGTFMRTLGDYSAFASTNTIDGRDIPQMIGKMAPIELSHGGKTWAQLYAAMALHSYGRDLNHNALWLSLSPEGKEIYRSLLDPARFYDAKTHDLIHLPENYFGVAARIAAIDYDLGLNTDRASLDDLLNRAAAQFTSGALFADDSLPTGRYDRYSNEYARALYDAAQLAGREDLLKAVSPSLKQQMKLWWDLLSPDGYGYSWGRSLGAISYIDTMEIVGFLGVHPEFRPVPLQQLAPAYNAAWTWLRNDFNKDRHLLSIFTFGRGDYGYITKEREWQQTTTFLAKIMAAHKMFMQAMANEEIKEFSLRPTFGNLARFEFFRDGPGRKFGVWLIRKNGIHFALPFVTGPKAAISDYAPMPHGFSGLAVPVEKIYPCLVPFLELEDGRTIAAVDGADEIKPAADGMSVTAVWKRWVVAGAQAGQPRDEGLVSEVTWSLQDNALRRTESLTSSKTLTVRRLWLVVPSRYSRLETSETGGHRLDHIISDEGTLDVQVKQSDWPMQISAFATGDSPLGRSDRGPIPLQLIVESKNISLFPGAPKKWELTLSAAPQPSNQDSEKK